MKYNSFSNPLTRYEFNNNIPYGSTNLFVDSNYWGTMSTQHIDSVIYDFFDYGNLSVVYYQPILSQTVSIDTACSLGFPTTNNLPLNSNLNSSPYPNPFSNYTALSFSHELKDASLLMYNVFGQRVRRMEHLSGNKIRIEREKLPDGVYIYEVVEKEMRIGNGKVVVE